VASNESEVEHATPVCVAASVRCASGWLLWGCRLRVIAQQAVAACMRQVRQMQAERDNAIARCREESSERRRLHHLLMEFRGNVRVFCRVRPQLPDEVAQGEQVCVEALSGSLVALTTPLPPPGKNRNAVKPRAQMFEFDKVFGSNSRTKALWKEVSMMVGLVLEGFNCCIFAYGATGAGKSFTMLGAPDQPGLNQRALHHLFNHKQASATIRVTVVEVYNDQVFDMMSSSECVASLCSSVYG